MTTSWQFRLAFLVALVAAGAGATRLTTSPARAEEGDAAVARTRKQVHMLDDLYKTAIVLVTTHYVDDKADLAAGAAFQKLFEAMKAKGHHEVRLLDATGQPWDDDNLPKDAFEKAAIAQIKDGKAYYEEVVTRDGKRYLRAATNIPVVLEKCAMCHEHYRDVPKGANIGALSYTIPVE